MIEFERRRGEQLMHMPGDKIDILAKEYSINVAAHTDKYKRLRDLDVFVMDNSIRESTVGQFFLCSYLLSFLIW